MESIEVLAKRFRKAIDTAWEKGELRNITPFDQFPKECCDLTCDLLGQYLAENGYITHQINAAHKRDWQRRHVWLVDEYGIVIDITGDQFAGKLLPEEDVDMVYIGQEGPVQEMFCKDRMPEGNTNFTDPNQFDPLTRRPNKRQQTLIDVNRIVRLYLEK